MAKSKRVLCEIVGGTACLIAGFLGNSFVKQTNIATKVERQVNNTVLVSSEKIAIVNLDTGVQKSGKTYYYSKDLIIYPNNNYETVSLEEAKSGLKKGKYAAYIIVPSAFSESVESINGTPKQSEFLYKFSTYLNDKTKEKLIYEVNQFEKQINYNISYIYIDAILEEFHKVQDQSKVIMNNDNKDLDNIRSVIADKLVESVTFQEVKSQNGKIKDIILTKQEKAMEDGVKEIKGNFDDALKDGGKDYKKVVGTKQLVDDAMNTLKEKIDTFQPFLDEKGNSYVDAGLLSLREEVNTNNYGMKDKRSDLTTTICDEINSYGSYHQTKIADQEKDVQEKINTTVVQELQNSLDEYLKGNNESLNQYLNEQKACIDTNISEYISQLQEYLKGSITSEAARENVRVLAQVHAKNAFEEEQKMMEPYILNQIERGACLKYNEMAAKEVETVEKVKQCKDELDAAIKEWTGTSSSEPENTVEILAETAEDEEPKDLKKVVEDKYVELQDAIDQLIGLSQEDVPEELEKPNVQAVVSQEAIDMNAFTSFVDLQQGVDASGNTIAKPDVILAFDPFAFTLKSEDISYRVPEYKMPSVFSIDDSILKKVESFYELAPERFESVVQKNLIKSIVDRDKVLRDDISKGLKAFITEQGNYQGKLDAFNPYSYVDTNQLEEDTRNISSQIKDMVSKMNETNADYRSYLSDFTLEANENIQSLKEMMLTTNDKTKKNVQSELTAIQNMRFNTSRQNIEMLKGFAGKLSFTRVGDLPNRAAYQFIMNPITYQFDNNTSLK